VITIPAQPAEPARLPPALQHRGRRMASRPGHREIWFAATAGALLIIAGLHLLPDAWSGARSARIWPGLVPAAAAASFTAAGLPTRAGYGCGCTGKNASGAGTAAALAIHRVPEGSAIALAGTAAVAAALAVHAFAEGPVAEPVPPRPGSRRPHRASRARSRLNLASGPASPLRAAPL
jgi:hypothetical protein